MEYVFEIDDAIPPRLCEIIIKKFDLDYRKHKGLVGNNVLDPIKKSTDLIITNLLDWGDIDEALSDILKSVIKKYINHIKLFSTDDIFFKCLDSTFCDLKDSGFRIQHTKQNEGYDWHHDDLYGLKRTFSCIMYLNDLDPSDGGATEFYGGKKIIPKTGKVVFFPSTWTYLHRGAPLIKNSKYIISVFIIE